MRERAGGMPRGAQSKGMEGDVLFHLPGRCLFFRVDDMDIGHDVSPLRVHLHLPDHGHARAQQGDPRKSLAG